MSTFNFPGEGDSDHFAFSVDAYDVIYDGDVFVRY